ncbi:transglycosylase SLT domain-containing protein [Streptococcus downei]|uniref:Transglycosylase protein n=1 Tax=Streptococcus downei MFe28 TaxID=764290 RepID=A0A380JBK8_STRDO|nr:transglycosylase SLT domain-containing protein [Streptococcus downei]EFQ56851.1 Transglycosylase-like domain protein [Streptococcus downei F0415]SUN35372.1 transglycosylase protein [Streptococcus downei MFe28]
MRKRKTNRTSDKLFIVTILTTFAAIVFGFISEHTKISISESSFAEEVSSTKESNKADGHQEKGQTEAKAAEAPASTATAPTETANPQSEGLDSTSEQAQPQVAASETSANSSTATVAASANRGPQPLSNGNTAGAIGSDAAAQMAAATGVSQATWEYIIARESNGNPNVANGSGASGLFQTMPGWGSTATVQDQVDSAINAYNAQGMSAWGM